MFSFCHWLTVIAGLPYQFIAVQPWHAVLTLILKARLCFRQAFDVRGTQCSSHRRSKMSGKANKIEADCQLGGSQKPLRKMPLSIILVEAWMDTCGLWLIKDFQCWRREVFNIYINKFWNHTDISVFSQVALLANFFLYCHCYCAGVINVIIFYVPLEK